MLIGVGEFRGREHGSVESRCPLVDAAESGAGSLRGDGQHPVGFVVIDARRTGPLLVCRLGDQ